MNKEEIRKEFFKLKNKGHSYAQCKSILKATCGYEITTRTLKRWTGRLDSGEWDLCDQSRRPHNIHRKVTSSLEQEVLSLRDKTGWGCDKLLVHLTNLNISRISIHRILQNSGKCRETKNKGKRKKWVRWQRQHPNSLWQIDHTDEQELFDGYTLSILDACSRYSLALVKLKQVTTNSVTSVLDDLIKKNGKPKQILTDNGGAYDLNSKNSRFDRWCRKRGIHHIRTKVHSPTTNGKVERLFKTMDGEHPFCNYDLELFRMRYNNFRPHSSLNNKTPADIYHDVTQLF